MTTHETLPPPLPPEGRRVAFVGKGGSGKSTIIGYMLSHWKKLKVDAAAMDADEPGDEENGSLMDWADLAELGGPVYQAPSRNQIRDRAVKLTPRGGLLAIDTGAWIRRAGNTHFAVLSSADLVVLTLAPTPMELDRAGSVYAALEHLKEVGAHSPRLVIALTMVNPSAASGDETAKDLTDSGFEVLEARIPRSDARDGYAQIFGRTPPVVADSPMDKLASEILAEVAR